MDKKKIIIIDDEPMGLETRLDSKLKAMGLDVSVMLPTTSLVNPEATESFSLSKTTHPVFPEKSGKEKRRERRKQERKNKKR